jgi:PLAC8 family
MATPNDAPAPSAPAPNAPPMEKSETQKDVDHWMGRLNHAAANSHEITAPTGTAAWSSDFFDCLNPVDSCVLSCCCPCVMFGRVHHRMHKDRNLAGFDFVNASVRFTMLVRLVGPN